MTQTVTFDILKPAGSVLATLRPVVKARSFEGPRRERRFDRWTRPTVGASLFGVARSRVFRDGGPFARSRRDTEQRLVASQPTD